MEKTEKLERESFIENNENRNFIVFNTVCGQKLVEVKQITGVEEVISTADPVKKCLVSLGRNPKTGGSASFLCVTDKFFDILNTLKKSGLGMFFIETESEISEESAHVVRDFAKWLIDHSDCNKNLDCSLMPDYVKDYLEGKKE